MPRFVPQVRNGQDRSSKAYYFVLRGMELLVPERGFGALESAPIEGEPMLLGMLEQTGCFALPASKDFPPPPGFAFRSLRSLFGELNDDLFGIAGRAMHLLEWDSSNRFCGRCGNATSPSEVERARKCTSCGASHYPKISPAVIGAVEHEGKLLLGRNASFARPFFSTFAGFVEPGESLEEAFAREVREEVGIEVKNIRYFGSQPWPFSSSLMIGFQADYAGGEVKPDPAEIAEARWFAPDAMPELPPRLSIARALIDDFVRRGGRKS